MKKFQHLALVTVFLSALPFESGRAQSPIFNWSGYYAGVHAGYSWGQERSVNSTGDSHLIKGTGAAIGLHGGKNWQSDNWIYGFEGEINVPGPKFFMNFANVNIVDERLDFFGSLRGRIGYVSGAWLFFVTGGYAFGQFDQDLNLIVRPGPGRTFAKAEDIIHGYTIGAGFERALLRNWSLRFEYLFAEYSAHFDPLMTAPFIRTTAPRDMTLETHTARIGISYRFSSQ